MTEQPSNEQALQSLRANQASEARTLLDGEIGEEDFKNFEMKTSVLRSWEALMSLRDSTHDHDGNNHHDHTG